MAYIINNMGFDFSILLGLDPCYPHLRIVLSPFLKTYLQHKTIENLCSAEIYFVCLV